MLKTIDFVYRVRSNDNSEIIVCYHNKHVQLSEIGHFFELFGKVSAIRRVLGTESSGIQKTEVEMDTVENAIRAIRNIAKALKLMGRLSDTECNSAITNVLVRV